MSIAKKRGRSPEDGEEGEVDVENQDSYSHGDAEEGEEHGRRGAKEKKRKHRHRRFPVMSGSGQSEADRRALRCRQRRLKEDLVTGAASGHAGELRPLALRDRNNALWHDVRHTREAVLDSENVELIADKASRHAEKIVQVPRYDAIRMAHSLARKGTVRQGSSSEFDWRGLGCQVGVCFNAFPGHVAFLFGPLDAEYAPKERKRTERRPKQAQVESENDDDDDEVPGVDQTGKKKHSDGNELSAVEQHISVIKRTLRKRSAIKKAAAMEKAEEYESQLSQEVQDESIVRKKTQKFVLENSSVNAVSCLFNPKSFTQTVENVFHFSFLVKQGKAGIKARSAEDVEEFGGEPGPAIRAMDYHDMGSPKQAIVALNMKDWKDMCNAYDVEDGGVPHRVDGKVAKKEK